MCRLVFCCYYVMYRLCTVMLNLSYFTLIPSQFEFTLPKNCTILHTIVYYTEQNSHQLLGGGKGQNEYCTVNNINAYSVLYSIVLRSEKYSQTLPIRTFTGQCSLQYFTASSYCLILKYLKGSVSREFRPLFFSWFEPIWAPDKQPKVFLKR